ncbi:MAG: phosphoadenylyl-sulfate reductase [Chloroflexi bacterium]|nr:MAG: phosphoadenylyl-sulfate reductase [Chloroflexota bacterium]
MSVAVTNEPIAGAAPEEVLRWALDSFPRVAIVASFQAESSVLIDMAAGIRSDVRIITLDTGRLPQATYDMIDRVRDRYSIAIDVVSPDPVDLSEIVVEHGANLFYRSPDLRRLCCDVRKSRPLARALRGYDAWVTGLRRQQSTTRAQTPVVAPDPEHEGLTKIAPLVSWSKDQVWAYIRDHDLPYHPLYERGYTSIGCDPCTRATTAGEDERAGRWWWEQEGEVKECGLHWAAK